MPLGKRLRGNNLIKNKDEIPNIIERLKTISKMPFLNVLADFEAAMNLNDLVLLSLDPFSTNRLVSENGHYEKFGILSNFSGSPQSLKFKREENIFISPPFRTLCTVPPNPHHDIQSTNLIKNTKLPPKPSH